MAISKLNQLSNHVCCCAHDHKPGCPFITYAEKIMEEEKVDREVAYSLACQRLHKNKCGCRKSNIMKNYPAHVNYHIPGSCSEFNNFYNTLAPYLPKDSIDKEGFMKKIPNYRPQTDMKPEEKFNCMCCCSSEISHNEALKFKIIGVTDGVLSDERKIKENLTWKQFKTRHQFETPKHFEESNIYDEFNKE